MIRLSNHYARRFPRFGFHSITPQNVLIRQLSATAAGADSAPKGIPYSKLTVGIPKEVYPLEKRVAATPDVSSKTMNANVFVICIASASFETANYPSPVCLSHVIVCGTFCQTGTVCIN